VVIGVPTCTRTFHSNWLVEALSWAERVWSHNSLTHAFILRMLQEDHCVLSVDGRAVWSTRGVVEFDISLNVTSRGLSSNRLLSITLTI